MLRAASRLEQVPHSIAISGWHDNRGGYHGLDSPQKEKRKFLGKEVEVWYTSHERAHILCSLGLSGWIGEQIYCLVWEGTIGRFYEISSNLKITCLGEALFAPGLRYAYLYYLADSADEQNFSWMRHHSMPGKIMALAGLADESALDPQDERVIDTLLDGSIDSPMKISGLLPSRKSDARHLERLRNIGVQSQKFKNCAQRLSTRLFDCFANFARSRLVPGRKLIVGGGCGLNCDWNERWRSLGLFSDVFVPPCTSDSGVAIGAAFDAHTSSGGDGRLVWSVYAGESWEEDATCWPGWSVRPLDVSEVALDIFRGEIVFWAQARSEIGPRALGNRSILASPFSTTTTDKLNALKRREAYRPIAPICALEDAPMYFDGVVPSPHMLYFHRVKDQRLKAITHGDGSARVQTVNAGELPAMHRLLMSFKVVSGVSVLCNTSLNLPGRGFFNRSSELLKFAEESELRTVVINETLWRRT